LALTAMEEPLSFSADDVRAEKEKALRAVSVPTDIGAHTARGQYDAGWQGGIPVIGFLQESGIPADSTTDTFAAIRLNVENRRWAGVRFIYARVRGWAEGLPKSRLFSSAPHTCHSPHLLWKS